MNHNINIGKVFNIDHTPSYILTVYFMLILDSIKYIKNIYLISNNTRNHQQGITDLFH